MRRFRLRRLWRVNCEALMRAAGQNLKRLLKKRGWGRCRWPQGALNALVEHPSEDHIPLHASQLPEKALACGEKLRVKDLVKPLPVLSMPLVFAPCLDSAVSAPLAKMARCFVLCGFPQLVCGSFETSF